MKYAFNIDTKYSIWEKEYIFIEAETLEDAKEIIREKIDNENYKIDVDYVETLYDTQTALTPESNDGYSTIEIYDEENNILFKNGKTN
jgi:hypothetical protein